MAFSQHNTNHTDHMNHLSSVSNIPLNSQPSLSSLTLTNDHNNESAELPINADIPQINQIFTQRSHDSLCSNEQRRHSILIFYLLVIMKSIQLIVVGTTLPLMNPFLAFILQSIGGRLIDILLIYTLLNLLSNIMNKRECQRFEEVSLGQLHTNEDVPEYEHDHREDLIHFFPESFEERQRREALSFPSLYSLDDISVADSDMSDSLPIPNIMIPNQSLEYSLEDLRAPRVAQGSKRSSNNIPQEKNCSWSKENNKRRDPKEILDDLITI